MKLKFKHLSAYLPYDLQVIIFSENETQTTCIDGLNKNPDEMVSLQDEEDFYINSDYNIFSFKPILRPLSDLDKEIEFNGEKFKPIDKLYKLISVQEMFDFKELITDNANLEFILKYPHDCIQLMLKLHFDVFGLIDKGLAVDINTL